MNVTLSSVCLLPNQLQQSKHSGVLINTIIIILLDVVPAFVTVIANALLIITLMKTRTLHTPSNVLVGALCATDLLTGLISQPMYLAILLRLQLGLDASLFYYPFWYPVQIFSGYSAWLILFVTIDRYLAICYPFKYCQHATCKRYSYILVLPWVPSIGFMFPARDQKRLITATYLLFICVMMVYCYWRIYQAIRKQQSIVLKIGVIGEAVEVDEQESKENKRKVYTILIITGCFMMCSIPFAIFLIKAKDINLCNMSVGTFVFFGWASFFSLLNSSLSPLVYCIRLRAIRIAMKALIFRRNTVDREA